MSIITVNDLRKTFQTKRKQPGLMGSLKAVVKPELQTVEAVKDITFELEPGELVAFIGPNGAGKSTTIKMLTGILLAMTLNFCVQGMIGLCAFITEDVQSFQIIYQKFLFILGGMLIPLDFFPGWLRDVSLILRSTP
jgi:ABC-type glutathione transport system ATPase component